MRYPALLLCLCAAPLAAAPRPALRLPAGLVIASIKVETHNVFDTDAPPENKWLYRAANRLHIHTRDFVIERELLFAVGDRYDAALIAETERNLRNLPFVRHAQAEAVVNEAGSVDVTMRTYDSWTLEVVANFKRAGGVASMKAGLADHNLLGWGKSAAAVYSRDGDAASQSLGWDDVQFLGHKHLQYSLLAQAAPQSRKYSMSLERPFYASIARSAFGGSASYAVDDAANYAGEAAAGSIRRRVGEAGMNFGLAIGTSTERTRHVKFGLLFRRSDFREIPGQTAGPVPDTEQLGFFQAGGDWEELDFLTVRRIQRFTHDEDYNLGLGVFPELKWSPYFRPMATTESQILPSLTLRKGFTWSGQLLLLSSAYSSRYVNGGNGNRRASFDVVYFVRGIKYQTLAFHTALDLGRKLDPATPLTLGEANGLRGYGLSQFAGDRRFLFNIEDRLFIWDEVWRLFDVGGVFFFDSGYAWPSARRMRPADLRNSVGLGLRVAPSRSASNQPARIDLAYALNDNRSRSRWSLSIQAGQAFGP